MVTSCYKCEDRYPGCHSDCEHYKKDRQKHEEMMARKRAVSDINAYMIHQTAKRARISQHKRRER